MRSEMMRKYFDRSITCHAKIVEDHWGLIGQEAILQIIIILIAW